MYLTTTNEIQKIEIDFSEYGFDFFDYFSTRFENSNMHYEFDRNEMKITGDAVRFASPNYIQEFVAIFAGIKSEVPSVELSFNETDAFLVNRIKKPILMLISQIEERQKKFDYVLEGVSLGNLNKANFKTDFEPYAFQVDHADKIVSSGRFADFSSPGAGKTIISYMAVASLMADNKINTVLVFGPKSAAAAWYNEWSVVLEEKNVNPYNSELNFSNKKASAMKQIKPTSLSKDKLNIIFVNYHKLDSADFRSHLIELMKDQKFMLIMDEAHYIKNIAGARHKGCAELSQLSQCTLMLTGTPIPRAINEAYYIVNSLWPSIQHGVLNREAFNHGYLLDSSNIDLINSFKKIFVRQNKQALVLSGDLKPLIESKVAVNRMPSETFLLDNIATNQADAKALDKWNRAYLIRMMQAASWPPLLEQSLEESIQELVKDLNEYSENDDDQYDDLFKQKDSSIENKVEEMVHSSEMKKIIDQYKSGEVIPEKWLKAKEIISLSDERYIVWDIFKKSMSAFAKYIKGQFPDRQVIVINGDITGIDRDNAIAKFRYHKNAILIASPATIAESLSLHRECDKAIYLNKNFTGSQWMQSKDRIHRLVKPNEESREKNIFYILGDGSIDYQIHQNLLIKEENQNSIID